MSKSQIEEAFAIAWGAFALALWRAGTPSFITAAATWQCICSIIAAIVYAWKEK